MFVTGLVMLQYCHVTLCWMVTCDAGAQRYACLLELSRRCYL